MEGINRLHGGQFPLNNKVKKRATARFRSVVEGESLLQGGSGNACATLVLVFLFDIRFFHLAQIKSKGLFSL